MILSFYGAFRAGTESASYRRFAEGFGLTRAMMGRFWDWYVPPGEPDRRRDPLVSPLDASDEALRALPPVFLNAAGLDPLLSDTLAFRDRLAAAGVAHELAVTPGVHHGFMQMSLRLAAAREAFAQAAAFYRSQATRQDDAVGLDRSLEVERRRESRHGRYDPRRLLQTPSSRSRSSRSRAH